MLTPKLFRPIAQKCIADVWSHCHMRGLKVCVVGAAGGVGQPLSLLLKQNPQISTLALHDKVNMKGIVADISHICTNTSVCSFSGEKQMAKAMDQAAIVVVSAGLPRKPGMSRSDLLEANASVAACVAKTASKVCPAALLAFITNPINTVVPIAAEVLKQEDAYDPNRLFGVTTLDVVRAKTMIGEKLGVDPQTVSIPVVGGHAGKTILPLMSQCQPKLDFSDEEREELVKRIQEAGTEVVEAKAGDGSATLSMAYAAANFVNSLLRAMNNEENVIECAYVQSDVSKAEFFSSPLLLGPRGIQKNLGLPDLDEQEDLAFKSLTEQLIKDIEVGVKYAN